MTSGSRGFAHPRWNTNCPPARSQEPGQGTGPPLWRPPTAAIGRTRTTRSIRSSSETSAPCRRCWPSLRARARAATQGAVGALRVARA
eukprot:2280937-Prymnesium_polylepis.1